MANVTTIFEEKKLAKSKKEKAEKNRTDVYFYFILQTIIMSLWFLLDYRRSY
jgi:hypothetical protein